VTGRRDREGEGDVGHVSADRAFEVFARHDREPELRHLGQVQADTEADAVVFAYTLYDERKWQDMFVVPKRAITQLIRPE
jgi:1,2-phenylacetyl-CoA epoxidase PaaB subunit